MEATPAHRKISRMVRRTSKLTRRNRNLRNELAAVKEELATERADNMNQPRRIVNINHPLDINFDTTD